MEIRLSEVIGGLSYALDLTEGEPAGHAQRSCLIGMRLADELGLDDETERSDLFYALLLKDAGCSANSSRMTALFGTDDHAAKRTSKRVDWARPWPAFVWASRVAARGQGREAKVQRLLAVRDEGEVTRSLMQARCERGAQIARMLGLSERTAEAIYALDEHWDGARPPRRAAGRADPARRADRQPRPDRRDLLGRGRPARRHGRRAQAPRRLVRPVAGRPRSTRSTGAGSSAPTSPATGRRTGP